MKTTTTQASSPAERRETGTEQLEQLARKIRRQPLQSVAQAAIAGYALHYVPVRRVLATAMRLIVPGIFAAGIYHLSRQVPSSWEQR